ncbi:MAG TPA: delta-60 repeat domain-containing protein, partial [Fimbriiglobus sp.]|nr:delta-60 repeat domain-containing protein [Fimbriiglobus sp.]
SGLAVAADGSLLVIGYHQMNADRDSLIARLTPQGTLDPSFAPGGLAVRSFSTSRDEFNDVALQPDGRIVAVGTWTRVVSKRSTEFDILVARFVGDSAPAIGQMMAPSTATHEETPTPSDPTVMETRRTAQESQAITVVDPSVDMHRAGKPGGEVLVTPARHAEASDADDPVGLLWGFEVDRSRLGR